MPIEERLHHFLHDFVAGFERLWPQVSIWLGMIVSLLLAGAILLVSVRVLLWAVHRTTQNLNTLRADAQLHATRRPNLPRVPR